MKNRTTLATDCSRVVTNGYPERHDMTPSHAERGVTLIELLVTISIAAILATIAVPNFQSMLINNRLSGISLEFMGALNLARSEAIKRGVSVVVCRRSSGTSCATGTGSWNNGWVIYADTNSNGANDSGEALRVRQEMPTNYTVYADDSAHTLLNSLTYKPSGMITLTNEPASVAICFNSDETLAKAIEVTRTRPRVMTDHTGNGIPDNGATDISSCEAP